ncbi:unnamed protein product [Symbiodinium sp. CCMP2592]|nr:unnamed protein product [Symbiodinium sp. CCMP2592]
MLKRGFQPRASKRSATASRYTTPEALALHESVAPARWCVTRSDLIYLRHEVWRAIQCGEIRPLDDSDRFEPSDDLYGPNVYTVNRQYIMPVTDEAGKVSWALMRHPEGLDCDVFISHAWQEGVFEFLSKVLHSWPAGSRHVWCCMLANPQNLDISSYLQSPSRSPFAQALQASTCVLVVPNRHCSIYTRLWCGYEAYIAHEEGKVILIARPSYSNHIGAALISATLVGLTGMLCGAFLLLRRCELHPIPLYVIATAAFISININHYRSRMLLNRMGAFTCGIVFLEWTTVNFDGAQGPYGPSGVPATILCVEQRLLILSAFTFFLLLEADRVNAVARAWEAEQLRRGYQGSIAHATCSEAADSTRILGEIGDKMEAVDYAIHVLLKAGMSSPTLREIARAGIDVAGAGNAVIAFPVVALVPLNLETLWSTYVDMVYMSEDVHLWIPLWIFEFMSFLVRIAIVVVLCRSQRDERCFIMKMMGKIVGLWVVLACPFIATWELESMQTSTPKSGWFAAPLLVYASILGFACLGMRRFLRCPGCGPCLLQLFLARGRGYFGGALLRSWLKKESDPATDTDSSLSSSESHDLLSNGGN